MPIYDYVCSNCRHVTEVIHGINDGGPKFCPNCGAEGTMKKALSTPTIVFKGSGWAKVDRRSGSGSSGTKASTKAKSSDASAASGEASKGRDGSRDASGSSSSGGSSASTGTRESSGTASTGSGGGAAKADD